MAEQRSTSLPDDEMVAEQAAGWIVRLGSDDADERVQAERGFAAWKTLDPRHAEAAASIENFVRQVQGVGQQGPARSVLNASRPSRRRSQVAPVARALALVAALALPAWVLLGTPSLTALAPFTTEIADLRGAAGRWRHEVLEDGSQLTLSGAGAVRLRFDMDQRVVELLRGSVLVDVAHDVRRPFIVETSLGRARALGTRFTVTLDPDGMRVEMLKSRVAVQTNRQWREGSREAIEVGAGERVTLRSQGAGKVEPVDPERIEGSWRNHQLVVDGQPLTEVLDQLARHHAGSLHFDREAMAGVRVAGVLPLDDTFRSLTLLQRSLPQLRVRSLASRWVWIDLAELR